MSNVGTGLTLTEPQVAALKALVSMVRKYSNEARQNGCDFGLAHYETLEAAEKVIP